MPTISFCVAQEIGFQFMAKHFYRSLEKMPALKSLATNKVDRILYLDLKNISYFWTDGVGSSHDFFLTVNCWHFRYKTSTEIYSLEIDFEIFSTI